MKNLTSEGRSSLLNDTDRYFKFPGDADNKEHVVDKFEVVDVLLIKSYSKDPKNHTYWLYTRDDPSSGHIIKYNDSDSLRTSKFNFAKPTVFLAHGWHGNGHTFMNEHLTKAFLEDGDVNVIVVDWGDLASFNYLTAKSGVPEVGRWVGKFIKWLVSKGASYDTMHLVGFSLGGHVVGHAGRETGSKVKRITALDPAGPLWNSDYLEKTDARYVEVIHANTRAYGFTNPCGHADFYVNGGDAQPGCVMNTCSHSKAVEYMIATVKYNNFLAKECKNMEEVHKDACTGKGYLMGNSDLNKKRSGIFRINTGKNFPFIEATEKTTVKNK